MNWGALGKGFASVADDIARSQAGQRLYQGMISDADDIARQVYRNDVGKGLTRELSSQHATAIMNDALAEANDFYKAFTAKNGITPDEYIEGLNPILYNVGRRAGYTTNVAKQAAPAIAMNAAFMAPMFLPYLMQPSQQEEQQYYE